MEGEKERERARGEEKESDEAEDFSQTFEGATLAWQERYSEDDLGLPIMHWEALNLRIAELEKQEEDRRERSKCAGVLESGRRIGDWPNESEQGSRTEPWSSTEDQCSSRVIALTSRLQNQMNLQLCFINNSESEDEDEEDMAGKEDSQRRGTGEKSSLRQASPSAARVKPTGLKVEVRAALRTLRDKLRMEQKEEQCAACCDIGVKNKRKRKNMDQSDLQRLDLPQLDELRASLTKAIHDLSSELVTRLLTRDQLRTEQDAMLLEVQDMTM